MMEQREIRSHCIQWRFYNTTYIEASELLFCSRMMFFYRMNASGVIADEDVIHGYLFATAPATLQTMCGRVDSISRGRIQFVKRMLTDYILFSLLLQKSITAGKSEE